MLEEEWSSDYKPISWQWPIRTILFYPLANQLTKPNMTKSVCTWHDDGQVGMVLSCTVSRSPVFGAQRHSSQWTLHWHRHQHQSFSFCYVSLEFMTIAGYLVSLMHYFRILVVLWPNFSSTRHSMYVYVCKNYVVKTIAECHFVFVSVFHLSFIIPQYISFRSSLLVSLNFTVSTSVSFSHLVMVLAHVECSL